MLFSLALLPPLGSDSLNMELLARTVHQWLVPRPEKVAQLLTRNYYAGRRHRR